MALPTMHGRGFLLSDGVDLQYSKNGVAFARLPLSFRNSRRDEDGNWFHDKELRVDVTVFGALAESLTEEVDGRTELTVVGEPHLEVWTDKDGKERTSVKMVGAAVWPTGVARKPAAASSARSDAPF